MAQDIGYAVVQVMAKRLKAPVPPSVLLGRLPTGAVVLSGATQTLTPFEGGASPKVGTSEKADAYGTLSLGAEGHGAFAEEAEAITAPTDVVISTEGEEPAAEGEGPPKGEAVVYLTFIVVP